jgi:endonuclease-3
MPTPTVAPSSIAPILAQIQTHYPNATYELNWQTPEQMLVATILAAQCTDERVNQVTATLFQHYPDPQAFAQADPTRLEQELKPTGFYKRKTKTVQAVCQALVEQFEGKVPQTMAELTSLPGVARKTANVVLNCCFNLPSGIIVDTHGIRVSRRLGLSNHKQADRIEQDLLRLIPQEAWTFWGPAMVLHGRYVCKSKRPNCETCPLLPHCPQIDCPRIGCSSSVAGGGTTTIPRQH